MPSTPYIDLARRAFDAIHAACPSLHFDETPSEHVDLNIDLPAQDSTGRRSPRRIPFGYGKAR